MLILVTGATGFVGSHVARLLVERGDRVRVLVRAKSNMKALDGVNVEPVVGDLRDESFVKQIFSRSFDEVYQFAADMGGAGYIFTGENDAHVMHNSAMINLHAADFAAHRKVKKIFYSSSACMYPAHNQEDPDNPKCGLIKNATRGRVWS